jgi:hypothetical protein
MGLILIALYLIKTVNQYLINELLVHFYFLFPFLSFRTLALNREYIPYKSNTKMPMLL